MEGVLCLTSSSASRLKEQLDVISGQWRRSGGSKRILEGLASLFASRLKQSFAPR
jgi:hypothetical protein